MPPQQLIVIFFLFFNNEFSFNNFKYSKGKTTSEEEYTVFETYISSANLLVDDIVECESSQNWLQYHSKPFAEVLLKWQYTYNFQSIDELYIHIILRV